MAGALPVLGAVAPAILTALGGQRKPMEYTSGLSQGDQGFQNWIRQQIQGQQQRGPSPNTMNAQSLLYNRFFGGMPQNMTRQSPMPGMGQQQQQPNFAGALPGLLGQQYPR